MALFLTAFRRGAPISCMTIIHERAAFVRRALALTALALLPGCSTLIPEAEAAAPSDTARTIRYWDCCKPGGAWPGKASLKASPVKSCAKDGKTVVDANTQSACSGGSSYMCASQQPWAVNADLAYGFAAATMAGRSESDILCACYELKFTNGPVANKKLVVQAIARGTDVSANTFELMIPGGGVGIFNGCQSQYGAPADGWGNRYGGISSLSDCAKLPSDLRPGCNWRFGWFQDANNPSATFSRIKCPTAITDKTGCIRKDD